MDSIKVMIIEDEHFLSDVLANRLRKENFTVSQAFDGEEALNLVKSDIPDLIVLDLVLPKKSGFEVMESISGDPQLSKIPIIVFSNLDLKSDMERAKSLGATDYYIKAMTSIDNFVGIVRNVFNRLQNPNRPSPQ